MGHSFGGTVGFSCCPTWPLRQGLQRAGSHRSCSPGVPRYWWLKISALATRGDWEEMEKFSKSKKSPIGYLVRAFLTGGGPVHPPCQPFSLSTLSAVLEEAVGWTTLWG